MGWGPTLVPLMATQMPGATYTTDNWHLQSVFAIEVRGDALVQGCACGFVAELVKAHKTGGNFCRTTPGARELSTFPFWPFWKVVPMAQPLRCISSSPSRAS